MTCNAKPSPLPQHRSMIMQKALARVHTEAAHLTHPAPTGLAPDQCQHTGFSFPLSALSIPASSPPKIREGSSLLQAGQALKTHPVGFHGRSQRCTAHILPPKLGQRPGKATFMG